MGQTYYEVLEVDPDATSAEIRTAYRERVLETHPDHNDAPDAADQFKRVSTARSVLTDGTERARYDRLGHDAYVRLAERSSGTNSPDSSPPDGGTDNDATTERTTRSGTETASADRSSSTTSRGTANETAAGHNRRGNRNRTRTGSGRTHSRGESSRRNRAGNSDGRTGSHHARQRARRQQKTAQQRASGGWTFVTEGGRSSDGSSNAASSNGDASSSGVTGTANGVGGATTATGTGTASAAGASRPSGTPNEGASSGFRYAVHDWEGEVDLEWEGQAITQTTAVTIGCLWLLYPLFVAASVTPLFPLAINAIVAACTLAFVGYLLTRPRVATAMFGFWSVLFPLGIDQLASVPAFSITGLVTLGFVWIPFGYAVALWWALRP